MSVIPAEGANLPISLEGIKLVVISIVFEVSAVVAVMLRLWSRKIKKKALCFNDYAVVIGLFSTTGLAIDTLITVYMGGEGQHFKFLGMKELRVWRKGFFAGQLLWAVANCGIKLSVLHLYITIFRGPTFKLICYVFMGLSVAFMLMAILINFLICTPVALNWDDFVQGHCGNQRTTYFSTGIINFLIDDGIVVLPMPLVWRLQMPVAKRVGVSAMFGIGAIICILTILRIRSIESLDFTDATFSCVPLALWAIIEPTLGIINACFPVMRPALHKIFGSDSMLWTLFSIRNTGSKPSKGSEPLGGLAKGKNPSAAGHGNSIQRLYDKQYALEEQKHIVQIERVDMASRGYEKERRKQENKSTNVIEIISEWDVNSTKIDTSLCCRCNRCLSQIDITAKAQISTRPEGLLHGYGVCA